MGSGGSSGVDGVVGAADGGRRDRSGGGCVRRVVDVGSKAPGANCAVVSGGGGVGVVVVKGHCGRGLGCVVSWTSQESRLMSMH